MQSAIPRVIATQKVLILKTVIFLKNKLLKRKTFVLLIMQITVEKSVQKDHQLQDVLKDSKEDV